MIVQPQTVSLAVADPCLRGTGKSPFAHVEQTYNVFSSYRVANDAPVSPGACAPASAPTTAAPQ